MRTVECNICGETISAATTTSWRAASKDHLEDEHDEEASEDDVHQIVDQDAYDAMDS